MQKRLENLVEKHNYLSIKVSELEELVKTLKMSFDDSLMASEDCYYLQSIINVIRHKSVKLKDYSESLYQKVMRLKLENEKFTLHK